MIDEDKICPIRKVGLNFNKSQLIDAMYETAAKHLGIHYYACLCFLFSDEKTNKDRCIWKIVYLDDDIWPTINDKINAFKIGKSVAPMVKLDDMPKHLNPKPIAVLIITNTSSGNFYEILIKRNIIHESYDPRWVEETR